MNVLLSRLDRIGDLVLSTPAIASVRRSWPDAKVTIVCSARNAVVMDRNLDVDEVLIAPDGPALEPFARSLRGRFDLAIALAPCGPDFRLVAASAAPKRVGYTYVRRYLARLTARRYLTHVAVSQADPALSARYPERVVRHEVDEVLDLVRLAGGRAIVRDLVVMVDHRDRAAVAHVPGGGIVFHLGLRWCSCGSTLAHAIATIGLLREFGLPVVVTFGEEARAQADTVRAAGVADAVVGGLTFSQWAATFEKNRVVLTVDTGASHVASAVHVPTAVLFENRYFAVSSREWAPYGVPSVALRKPSGESALELATSRDALVAAVGKLLLSEGPERTRSEQPKRPC